MRCAGGRPTVEGRPEGGWPGEFEIVCCDCGDNPDLDYRDVSPALQRIRGPCPITAGVPAYARHARRHPGPRDSGERVIRQIEER